MLGERLAEWCPVVRWIAVAAIVFFCLGSGRSVTAQGTVNFANRVLGKVIAPVFGIEPCPCASTPITGNNINGVPPGCRVYNGAPVAGTGYTAALYAGPLGSAADQLVFVAATGFRDASGAGFFVGREVAVPGIAPGERATFQVRAWDNRGGSLTSWQQVVAAGDVPRGVSALFSPAAPLGGLGTNGEMHATVNLNGLTSFNLTAPAEIGCAPLCRPASQAVALGRRAEFCFEVCGSSCQYQWYFNGGAIPNATNRTLLIPNVQQENLGQYFCIIDLNQVSPVATLSAQTDAVVLGQPCWLFPGALEFGITGPAGPVYVIERSTGLSAWNVVAEVTNFSGQTAFQDSTGGASRGFYRARVK